MRSSFPHLKIVLFALLVLPTSAWATNYYVATTGNDGNSGTAAAPFRTIQKAVDTTRNGDTVLVRAGTYREEILWDTRRANGVTVKAYDQGGTVESVWLDGRNARGTSIDNARWTVANCAGSADCYRVLRPSEIKSEVVWIDYGGGSVRCRPVRWGQNQGSVRDPNACYFSPSEGGNGAFYVRSVDPASGRLVDPTQYPVQGSVLERAFDIGDRGQITIDGLNGIGYTGRDAKGSGAFLWVFKGDDITIQNATLLDNGFRGRGSDGYDFKPIAIFGSASMSNISDSSTSKRPKVLHMHIQGSGRDAITFYGQVTDGIISGNVITDSPSHNGITMLSPPGSEALTRRIVIADNTVNGAADSCIAVYACAGCVVERNKLSFCSFDAGNDACIRFTGGNDLPRGRDNVARNNVCSDSSKDGINASGQVNLTIDNNTVVAAKGTGIDLEFDIVGGLDLRNNLLMGNGDSAGEYELRAGVLPTGTVVVDHNLYFNKGGDSNPISWNGREHASRSAFRTATGNEQYKPTPIDALDTDPKLSGFQLAVGSPAIDRGANLCADGVAVDIDGRTRPCDQMDIGAYEKSGSDGGPPAAPVLLSVTPLP